jgi:trehalose 6-phosphate synthase/phosphatase
MIANCIEAKEVLAGMLGANVIGFQTYSYARHFISSCTRILGNESTSKGVDNAGVPVDVVVQPIGVDPMRVKKMQSGTTVQARAASFREVFAGRKVILGLESADQCRGIIHKLKSFEKLLSMYSDLIGNVCALVDFQLLPL